MSEGQREDSLASRESESINYYPKPTKNVCVPPPVVASTFGKIGLGRMGR